MRVAPMFRPGRWVVVLLTVAGAAACFIDRLTAPGVGTIAVTLTADSVVVIGGAIPARMTVGGAAAAGGPSRVLWSSTDPAVATVDSTGQVHGVAKGAVTITGKVTAPDLDSAVSRSVAVRVAYASIAIDSVDSLTGLGQTHAAQVRGRTAQGTAVALLSGAAVQWHMAPDTTALTVDASGLLTARANGAAFVVATFEGLRDSVPVKVRQVARSVTFTGGASFTFTALNRDTAVGVTAVDVAGAPITSPTVVWSSMNVLHATVSTSGTLRALTRSADTIGAQVDTAKALLVTHVSQVPKTLALAAGSGQVDTVGRTTSVAPAVQVRDAGAAGIPGVTVTFTVIGNGGKVGTTSVPTDTGGLAATAWTLGDTVKTDSLRVTSAGLDSVFLTATAVASHAKSLAASTAQAETTTVNTTVPVPPAVAVRDTFGNAVSGAPVTFVVDSGAGKLTGASPSTGANGVAAVTSWQVGTAAGANNNRVSASTPMLPGVTIVFRATGTPGQASGTTSTLTIAKDTLIAGQSAVATFRAKDAFGNPETTGGATVVLGFSGGTSRGTIAGVVDSGDGTYTATIKGTTAGSPASLGGTVNGQAIATTLPSVVVLHGAPGQLTVSAGDNQTAPAGTAVAIQPAVTVADSFGNLIQNDTVFWAVTGGSGVAKGDTTLTSAGGFASLTQWVLGASLGGNMLLASTGTLNHTFHATGSAPVISDSVPLGNSMLGLQPLGVAIDTARNLIYVADSGSNEVTIIDEATLRAIDSVPVGVDPVAVAVNPSLNRIYVADAGDSTLDVIDGSSRTVLSTIPLGASPLNIAIDPATDSIYVAAGPLVVVDPTLNAVAGSVSLSVFAELVAVNGTQHVVYAGAYNWASVAVMSLSNRAPLAPIPVSGAGLAVNPATNRLYVADQDGTVRMFDGASNAQLLSVSSPLKPSRVDVDVAANRVYVSHCFGTVDILDGTTLGTLGTISGRLFASCTSGESPIRFAVDSKLHLVVGTNHGTDLVVIADGGSAAVQAVVPRVTSISGLAVDPSRGRIYAAAAPAGQVLVVDESSHRVIDAQSVATGLGTIAIDVSRNRLYVANGSSVLMVDASTLVPGSPISLTDQVFDLAVNPVTNHAYARRSFATDDIDGGTGGVVGTLTTGGATQGIAVDTLRNLVYIAIDGSPGASIFDGATDAFLKLMTTPGSQGGGAGINPVTNRIFVIDEDSPGRVEDYDGAARALVTGVQVGPFPGRLAVDSKLNVVYVIIGGGIWYVSGGLDAVVVTLSTGTATAITVDPVAGKAFVASGTALVTITP